MALTRITKGVIKPNENYQAGIVTATGLDVNGNADISGDLNVEGILTYEDVTSIDAVGIITAQKGIHVGAGVSAVGVGTFGSLDISGDIDVDGHTNLDNVSIVGVTTITGTSPTINFEESDGNPNYRIIGEGGALYFQALPFGAGASGRLTLHSAGNVQVNNNLDVGAGIDVTGNATVSGDIDVDGHTNLDNLSVAGVTTFTDDVYFDGATAGRDIVFDRSDNQLEFAPNAKAYFGGSFPLTIYNNINSYISQNPNAALFIESKDVQIYGSGNGYNSPIFIARNGIVELGYEPSGGSLSTQLKTSAKGITVGTGVTIETNGQATFVGVVTFGSGSTTIDNNVVNVGTALTLGHTQGLQFHTQNLHSRGFEVNQINASGIVTARQGVHIDDSIVHIGDTNTKIRFPAADTISFETSGYERFRITSGGVFGFNTNNPDTNFRFDFAGSARFGTGSYGSRIQFSRSGLGDELVIGVDGYGNSTANEATIQSSINSPRPLVFATNNTERLRITRDGEMLLGTGGSDRGIAGQRFNSASGWSGTLQIEKQNPGAGNNNVPFLAITAWNGANEQYTGGISFNRSNNNTNGTHGAVTTSQQLGNIAFNGSDGTNFIQGAEIFAIPDQTFATNDGPASLVFATVPDGTSETRPQERLRIKSDGGILQTKTGGNANFTISRNESVGTTDQQIGVIDFASNTAHTVQARVGAKTLGTSNVGGDLVVETRANGGSLDERFRITGSGTLGVNLTTPKTTKGIHISKGSGNGGIGNSYSLANEYLHFGFSEHNSSGSMGLFAMGFGYVAGGTNATNSPAYLGYRETSVAGYTNGALVFATRSVTTDSAPTERLRIDSNGIITCGHGANANLHGSATAGICLNGNGNSGQIIANADGNRALIIGRQSSYGQVIEFFQGSGGSNTNQAAITIPAYDTFGIETNGGERLRIGSTGKVGINNTSPARTLDIKPEAGATDSNLALTCGNATGYSQLIFANSTDQYRGGLYYYHNDDRMTIYGGAGQRDIAEFEAPGSTAYMGVGNNLGNSSNDGSWGARFNLYATNHSKLELFQDTDDVKMAMWVHSGHSQGYLTTLSSHSLYLTAGNNNARSIILNTDGQVRTQSQPSFAAYRNQSTWNVNGAFMVFNTTRHNIGGHYDTSNGRFTAPIDGSYQINFYSIYRGSVTNAYVQVYKNGSRLSAGGDYHFTNPNLGNNWETVAYSQVLYLSANDYVQMYSPNNIDWHGNHWQCFSGYLLG